MKVALLIRRFITTGGAERYAVEVTRRLAKLYEVHIFAQQWDHTPEGPILHRVPLIFEKPRWLNQWWFSWCTSRMARDFDVVYTHERVTRFDVMHIHSGTFVGGLKGARGERRSALRTWLKILTGPNIWCNWVMEKFNYRLVSGRLWIAVSQMVKREVQRYYRVPDDAFIIAHSGVEPPPPDIAQTRAAWRRKLGFANEDVVALFVGTEFRRKGLKTLVEAMGLLQDRAPRLVIVGGDNRARYEARLRELQLSDRVTWAGWVKDVSVYYALADIFVLPTLSDPSPLAPLEAMASGCATIISSGRYTGAAELVGNGEAILLEDPQNPSELASAVEQLLDSRVRNTLAAKGRELTKRLSWDKTASVVAMALEQSCLKRGKEIKVAS